MDIDNFDFYSEYPIEKRVYYKAGSISLPPGEYRTTTLSNTYGSAFIPRLLYSADGGASWVEAPNSIDTGSNSVEGYASCSNSNIQIVTAVGVGSSSNVSLKYKLIGVSRYV